MGGSSYESSGRIQVDRSLLSIGRECSRFQQKGYKSDDTVTTHCAIALVMHEYNPEVSFGCYGRGHHTPIHIAVTTRLPHQRAPNMVEVLLQIASPFQHGCT